MKELKFRFYDSWNDVMTYSDSFPNLAAFFSIYQATVDGENDPVLMQYTGLNDRYNNPIYDGDIIQRPKYNQPFIVHFREPSAAFVLLHESDHTGFASLMSSDCEYKIIGNIYENKSLLEEMK